MGCPDKAGQQQHGTRLVHRAKRHRHTVQQHRNAEHELAQHEQQRQRRRRAACRTAAAAQGERDHRKNRQRRDPAMMELRRGRVLERVKKACIAIFDRYQAVTHQRIFIV